VPVRPLPTDPSVEQLKKQAKDLQRGVRDGDPVAIALAEEFHPGDETFARADALLVIARRYGFPSWPRLLRHVETVHHYSRWPHRQPVGQPVTSETGLVHELLALACLNYGSDSPDRIAQAKDLLADHSELAGADIYTMAATGNVESARALLATDPDAARRPGGPHDWEPVLYLAYSRVGGDLPGHSPVETARLLLDHGADPDAGYLWEGLPSPFTALTGAFGGGEGDQPPHPASAALARTLLDAGADPNDSQSLYNRQFKPTNDHLVLLFEYGLGTGPGGPWHKRMGPALDGPEALVERQLGWAARRNMPDRVRLLLDHGVDPNGPRTCYPMGQARNALEVALFSGHEEVAAILVAAGATTPSLDPVEQCVAACMAADRAEVDRLRQADADVVERTRNQHPGLVGRAADLGHTEAVRLLVEVGFDVEGGPGNEHPLHWAAFRGSLDTVQALVELGADTTRVDDRFDATPRGWADHAGHHEIADYLRSVEPEPQPEQPD
jgi:ankyrin repeat protein